MRCSAFGNVFSRSIQVPIFLVVICVIIVLVWPMQYDFLSSYQLYNIKGRSLYSAAMSISDTVNAADDIIDYSRCSLQKPFKIFVHEFEHPLAEALQNHLTATKTETDACLFISFTNGDEFTLPTTWDTVSSGSNHIMINLNDEVSIAPEGNEMIVQSHFMKGHFRPSLDFSLFPDVQPFNTSTIRPYILPPRKEVLVSIVSDTNGTNGKLSEIECKGDCSSSLNTTTFCLLPPSQSFQSRLLSSLRAGCVPVVLSPTQPLPFHDQLDWTLASFSYPLSMLSDIPEILEEIEKEELIEMRRRGRIYLARIDNAEALATSLIAAIADRLQLNLPLHPEVPINIMSTVPGNDVFQNTSTLFNRKKSKAQTMSSSRLYSRARWNSGRLLSASPRTVHDVPMMPADAGIYKGIKEHFKPVNGKWWLGLTRDEEQFTVVMLTYNRDKGVKNTINKLKDCPYLNKIIVVWNHQERRPNISWPEIHVPIEFVLSPKNSLNSRFLPFENIETEAVLSMDDDVHFTQSELVFGFKVWRENRDRLVGFPARTHVYKNGHCEYRMYLTCEHSMVLTGLTFLHKEFLFEYSYNQHPAILEYVDKNFNCEDIAMNMLIAHLTRQPALTVDKKTRLTPSGSKPGLTARKAHKGQRGACMDLFSALYGYNPLLFSQAVVHSHSRCNSGL